jgi:hypothetical protein
LSSNNEQPRPRSLPLGSLPGAAPGDDLSNDPPRPDTRAARDDLEPFPGEDFEDTWEPPTHVLAGPLQLLAALVAAVIAGVTLLGVLAAISWLFRGGY